IMASVGLPGSVLFLANSSTELSSQHYLFSTTQARVYAFFYAEIHDCVSSDPMSHLSIGFARVTAKGCHPSRPATRDTSIEPATHPRHSSHARDYSTVTRMFRNAVVKL